MSLHALATHMAAKGRNGDSVLVHMTPGEVAGLHALALKHGGELTINPDTGLPEANFLKSLLPMLAGAALNFFVPGLGAAVGGAFGLGAAAGTGIAVGGLTTLATGSLSRGLMAGLGAYGGAGLTEGLIGAGAGTAAGNAAALGVEGAATGAGSQAAMLAEQNAGFGAEGLTRLADSAKGAIGAAPSTSGMLSAGFDAASKAPGAFLKNNLGNIAAASAPIMADMMVPTTTKMPENTNPAYIRQKVFDPGTQTYRSLTPVKASEWKDKNFSDIYRGYNDGGIVALAIGGDTKTALEAAYAANDVAKINEIASANKITAADVADTYKGFDTSGIQGLQLYTPPAAPTYTQYTPEQIGGYLTANPNVDINKAIAETNADPAAVNKYIASLASPFVGSTDTKGGSGTLGIYNNMVTQGVDPNEYYAAALANDSKYGGWDKGMIQKGYDLDKGAYALSAQIEKDKIAADPKLGYDKQWVNFMDTNKYTVDDMAQAFGLSRNEVKRRYDAVKAAEAATKVVTPVVPKTTGPGSVTSTVLDTNPTTNAPIGTTNPYGNVNNPGDLTFNVDGTTTVQPNIPGRPYGGFSGMDEVKNAYTKGGGSLGYTPYAPKTADEHDELYNRFTPGGDSEAAYNYLMGKGGAKYPTKSRVGQIATPYRESVMGYPASTNKAYTYDAASGKMVRNPDYVAPMRDSSGNVTYGMSLNEIKSTLAKAPLSGQALYDWAQTNGASAQDIADATGRKLSDIYAEFRDAAKKAADKKKVGAVPDSDMNVNLANGGMSYSVGGGLGSLGSYSDGGRLLKGPGDGVSDSIPATIGQKQQPARLADGEFVVPARIVSELGNGSTDAGAKKLYAMMDRVQRARGKTTGKNKVAANSRADKYLPA